MGGAYPLDLVGEVALHGGALQWVQAVRGGVGQQRVRGLAVRRNCAGRLVARAQVQLEAVQQPVRVHAASLGFPLAERYATNVAHAGKGNAAGQQAFHRGL